MQQNGTGTFQKWSSGVTLENSFPQVMNIKILRKTRRDRADYTFHKELTQCQTKRLLKKWCEHKSSRSIKAQKKIKVKPSITYRGVFQMF